MKAELRRLSRNDGIDVYDMLQELPADENGFMNGCNSITFDEYKAWLAKCENIADGIGLEDWMVPQDVFWLYIDGKPVGMGKLRHRLTDKLREEGGHMGYAIRPVYRGKGYGKLLIKLMLEKAHEIGIEKALVTVYNDNHASINAALANGGVISRTNDKRHYIWLDCM